MMRSIPFQNRYSELLKSFRSDVHDGRRVGHLEIFRSHLLMNPVGLSPTFVGEGVIGATLKLKFAKIVPIFKILKMLKRHLLANGKSD